MRPIQEEEKGVVVENDEGFTGAIVIQDFVTPQEEQEIVEGLHGYEWMPS